MKTIVHVNQYVIKSNNTNGLNDPVLTVKTYKDNRYAHRVRILGNSEIVYSKDKPLSCGARVWIETQSRVLVDNEIDVYDTAIENILEGFANGNK